MDTLEQNQLNQQARDLAPHITLPVELTAKCRTGKANIREIKEAVNSGTVVLDEEGKRIYENLFARGNETVAQVFRLIAKQKTQEALAQQPEKSRGTFAMITSAELLDQVIGLDNATALELIQNVPEGTRRDFLPELAEKNPEQHAELVRLLPKKTIASLAVGDATADLTANLMTFPADIIAKLIQKQARLDKYEIESSPVRDEDNLSVFHLIEMVIEREDATNIFAHIGEVEMERILKTTTANKAHLGLEEVQVTKKRVLELFESFNWKDVEEQKDQIRVQKEKLAEEKRAQEAKVTAKTKVEVDKGIDLDNI